MCGIVGFTGRTAAQPILIEGLKRLEYRGYDSAGVAIQQPDGALEVVCRKGKVAELQHTLSHFNFEGTSGIGHTRWATHGRPSEANAHPHISCDGDIAVVHNGIIENFAELREELKERGHRFRSDTDTEVIATYWRRPLPPVAPTWAVLLPLPLHVWWGLTASPPCASKSRGWWPSLARILPLW